MKKLARNNTLMFARANGRTYGFVPREHQVTLGTTLFLYSALDPDDRDPDWDPMYVWLLINYNQGRGVQAENPEIAPHEIALYGRGVAECYINQGSPPLKSPL